MTNSKVDLVDLLDGPKFPTSGVIVDSLTTELLGVSLTENKANPLMNNTWLKLS